MPETKLKVEGDFGNLLEVYLVCRSQKHPQWKNQLRHRYTAWSLRVGIT